MAKSQNSIRRRKSNGATEKISAAGKIVQAGAGELKFRRKKIEKISQYRKLSHSAENTKFQILIHCETNIYPYTLPKHYLIALLKLYAILIFQYPIPYFITMPKVYPTVIHYYLIRYLITLPENTLS